MSYMIGIVLALGVCGYATLLRLDRDRAFYTAMAFVVASYYVLFAAMGATGRVIVIESLIAGGFVLVASLGFRKNYWLVAAALGAHGVFDAFHAQVVTNPGVPMWWPAFCGSFDVAAGGYLAWLLAPVANRGIAARGVSAR